MARKHGEVQSGECGREGALAALKLSPRIYEPNAPTRTHSALSLVLLPSFFYRSFIELLFGFRVRAVALSPVGGVHAVALVIPAAVGHHPRRGGSPHRELAQRERVYRADRVHQMQDHQLGTQVGESGVAILKTGSKISWNHGLWSANGPY